MLAWAGLRGRAVVSAAMSDGVIHSGLLDGAAPLIRELGGDPLAIALACGLPPTALETDGVTLPGAGVVRFMELAAEACAASDFALRMAVRRGGLQMLGPVWSVISSALTVGDGLTAGSVNLPFRMTAITARVVQEGGLWALEIDTNCSVPEDVQITTFCLGLVVLQVRAWLGSGWRPLTTQFRHAAPPSRSPYAEVFGHALQFDQDRNAIVLDRLSWRAPLPTGDQRANRILGAALRHERSLAGDDLVLRVTQHLRAGLPMGRVALAHTAADLGLAPRTLQHRLQGAGVTFHQLLDEVREDLALRYLQTSYLPAYQIGELLHFSDSSAFSRFLRQRTGRSPRQIRRDSTRSPPAGGDALL